MFKRNTACNSLYFHLSKLLTADQFYSVAKSLGLNHSDLASTGEIIVSRESAFRSDWIHLVLYK